MMDLASFLFFYHDLTTPPPSIMKSVLKYNISHTILHPSPPPLASLRSLSSTVLIPIIAVGALLVAIPAPPNAIPSPLFPSLSLPSFIPPSLSLLLSLPGLLFVFLVVVAWHAVLRREQYDEHAAEEGGGEGSRGDDEDEDIRSSLLLVGCALVLFAGEGGIQSLLSIYDVLDLSPARPALCVRAVEWVGLVCLACSACVL